MNANHFKHVECVSHTTHLCDWDGCSQQAFEHVVVYTDPKRTRKIEGFMCPGHIEWLESKAHRPAQKIPGAQSLTSIIAAREALKGTGKTE